MAAPSVGAGTARFAGVGRLPADSHIAIATLEPVAVFSIFLAGPKLATAGQPGGADGDPNNTTLQGRLRIGGRSVINVKNSCAHFACTSQRCSCGCRCANQSRSIAYDSALSCGVTSRRRGDVQRLLLMTVGLAQWTRSSSASFPSNEPEALPLVLRDHRCRSHCDALHGGPDREVEPRLGAVDVKIGDDVASASASDHAFTLVLLAHVDDS